MSQLSKGLLLKLSTDQDFIQDIVRLAGPDPAPAMWLCFIKGLRPGRDKHLPEMILQVFILLVSKNTDASGWLYQNKGVVQSFMPALTAPSLVKVEDQVQLADVAKVAIQAFHEMVDLAGSPPGGCEGISWKRSRKPRKSNRFQGGPCLTFSHQTVLGLGTLPRNPWMFAFGAPSRSSAGNMSLYSIWLIHVLVYRGHQKMPNSFFPGHE